MHHFKKILVAILLLCISFVAYSVIPVNESDFTASVRTTDPLNPVLILTNNSTEPCQVISSSLGTLSVSHMMQDGKEIQPIAITAGLDDGLEAVLSRQFQTLKPGEHIEIPVQTFPYNSEYALQTLTWSKETGPFGVIYPFKKNSPYRLEVSYSSPLAVTSGPPLCGIASGTNDSFPIKSILIGVAVAIALVLLIIGTLLLIRLRKTHKKIIKTTILVFALCYPLVGMPHPAHADYSVPESAVGQFDTCMALFERYPDITGPVLDQLDSGRIILFTNTRMENYATDWPDGTYHIHWDSSSEYNYYSDDGSSIPSTPCDRLFHEMYHIYELMNDSFSREYCAGTGIETKEVNATRAQNRLREAMGLPPRTHYGTERLPAGECTDPAVTPTYCTGPACGESTGEPHLKTLDGMRYDFQAVGEFILARDSRGDFEVQTRQEPWSTARDVSLNTAVAIRVGDDRVELRMNQQKISLLINGKQHPLENVTLKNGGNILKEGSKQIIVAWPDGSKVFVSPIGVYGLDVIVNPVQAREGTFEGLLGNFNGKSTDDLLVRGKQMSIEPDFEKLYPVFADSWRVDDTSSLFKYEQGKNTNSYTDKTFPDKYVSLKDFPNRGPAELLCKNMGIFDPHILENCIFDVTLTGRPEFAYSASRLQPLSNKTIDYGGEKLQLSIAKPGAGATATFEGTAKEKVSLLIANSALPYQCGGFGIVDPNGEPISTGCIVKGSGFVDATLLPINGTYSVYLDPVDNTTGQVTAHIIRIKDFNADIVIGGPPVTAKLSQPGAIATLTFSGIAGQRVFVEILSGTLSDQCGGFSVNTPDGTPLDSACTTRGKGTFNEKGIVLPETGQYTIVIDPADSNTGEVTIKAHN